MTYISIDTNKKQALLFLEYVKTLPFVKVYQEPNKDTLKAMDDAKKGKTKKFVTIQLCSYWEFMNNYDGVMNKGLLYFQKID